MAKGPTTVTDNDLATAKRTDLVFRLAPGVTLDDALKPEYWAHVGGKRYFKPFARIELQAVDPVRFVAETVVIDAGPGFVKLKLLAYHDLTDAAVAEEAKDFDEGLFKAKHDGFGKWSVVRKSDGVAIKGGFASKEDAQVYAITHRRTVAA